MIGTVVRAILTPVAREKPGGSKMDSAPASSLGASIGLCVVSKPTSLQTSDVQKQTDTSQVMNATASTASSIKPAAISIG